MDSDNPWSWDGIRNSTLVLRERKLEAVIEPSLKALDCNFTSLVVVIFHEIDKFHGNICTKLKIFILISDRTFNC